MSEETPLDLSEALMRYLYRYLEVLARKVAARYDLHAWRNSNDTWVLCDPEDGQQLGVMSDRHPFVVTIDFQKADFMLVIRLRRRTNSELTWTAFSGQEVLDTVLPEIEAATGLAPRPLSVIEELVDSEMS